MAKQSIKIEIRDGSFDFDMHNFGHECEKESLFLLELGKVTSSKRDDAEYNRNVVRVKQKT